MKISTLVAKSRLRNEIARDLVDGGRLGLDLFGFCLGLRSAVRTGLRIADSLGEHLAEFSLRPGRLPHARSLPANHLSYMGMFEANCHRSPGFSDLRWPPGLE